jgi:hypothetical protein
MRDTRAYNLLYLAGKHEARSSKKLKVLDRTSMPAQIDVHIVHRQVEGLSG